MATKKTNTEVPEDAPQDAPNLSVVNNATSQSDADALHGHFCTVTGGPHEGRYAVLIQTATTDAKGRPEDVLIRTRDDDDEYLTVKYSDLAPAEPGGR